MLRGTTNDEHVTVSLNTHYFWMEAIVVNSTGLHSGQPFFPFVIACPRAFVVVFDAIASALRCKMTQVFAIITTYWFLFMIVDPYQHRRPHVWFRVLSPPSVPMFFRFL